MKRRLLFSVTIDDCEIQTFRSGGKGGGNQNARDTGVRLIHHPSGARAECRETRYQKENKQRAFLKMASSAKFKAWHRLEVAKLLGKKTPAEIVDEEMNRTFNFKTETKNEKGQWT